MWNLPKMENGTWVPGEWMPPVPVSLGKSGYHVTDQPTFWHHLSPYAWDLDIYLAEIRGESETDLSNIAAESVRLLRPATTEDLAVVGVFASGTHHLNSPDFPLILKGDACVMSSSPGGVFLHDNSRLKATGRFRAISAHNQSILEVSGSGMIFPHGDSVVNAEGDAHIYAVHRSKIVARGSCHVDAHNSTKVLASGEVKVKAYGGFIEASENAQVSIFDPSVKVHVSGNAVVSYPQDMAKHLTITRDGNATLRPLGGNDITTGAGLNNWSYQGDYNWVRT